ncbi:NADP-dependent oxidoreductase domain-containing protein [Yarrowia lipolytica]|jgi:voltage-dependent potassium channel beta subunit|uniref:YALI0A00847p n=2 Tax=Yarrowia lipolytica TaxID=4952 RepID=Q6CI80_YARLI|nr:YALI0A00847p [Yarrowia lipolytica CLIB122]AOW00108.1 hypothetical protein YALI1_A01122g [Yarrowia lipolytica]KAB8280906.1 NADP-dependent oxidoreductase domain-containing protein [Yarrowia lipolytica]KAE8170184.1 NADP-dependent oxidoreductase domain-containing protein [Yarrowia lipolytica]KAJ8051248.1 NADP-dependent oxidoreductase domain-containing protein [Yarrowia lipolytica]QNP95678.1 Putative voltage-gated potassium channel subunit beta [Yarrowia lipolytica]|eukprot:XP_499631.1 YALI0A00847p [Yarrowia lipolytica CLIB122]
MSLIPKQEYRFLGPSGLRVSSLSLGSWINYGDGGVEDKKTLEIFDKAFKSGINFFDTAEVYRAGEAETSMGKIIKDLGWKRTEYVISTKLFWGPTKTVNALGLSRKHVLEGIDESLKRLQLDYVDVVFAHRPDRYTPIEEVVRAFTQVINDGKAFYWGTSMWTSYEIERANHAATKYGLIPPIAEQPVYNLLERDFFEKELGPVLKDYNYGTTIWSPLAQGILTGKYLKEVPKDSRFSPDKIKNDPMLKRLATKELESDSGLANAKKVAKFVELSEELGVKPANLALAWLLKQPHTSTVILGATRVEQLEENLQTYEILDKVTDEVLEKIEKIFDNKPARPENFGRL